jgi:hypothetical protein
MIAAAQPQSFPLHCFNRKLAAGRERSTQSRSPLQLLSRLCERVTASTRCMQFAALAAAALLAAEAWGVSSALATRDASLYRGAPANCRPGMHCGVSSCPPHFCRPASAWPAPRERIVIGEGQARLPRALANVCLL